MKMWKRISMAGLACLLLICCTPVMNVSAEPKKAETTTKKETAVDENYGTIKVEHYYKKIVLQGETDAIRKINKTIQKDCDQFLKDSESLIEYAQMDSQGEYHQNETYYYRATSKVAYNDNGIISIKISTSWYAGGVSNTDTYGMTFDLQTGKKLRLDQVCADKTSKVASALKSKIQKEDSSLDTGDVTSKNVKNMDFYLKPGKKAVVCFGPYELGWGGWVRTYTVKSKYE